MYSLFSVWLLPLGVFILRFIRVLYISILYSSLLMSSISLARIYRKLMDTHLSVKIPVQPFVWTYTSILLDEHLGVEWLGCRIGACLTFQETAKLFSKSGCHSTTITLHICLFI